MSSLLNSEFKLPCGVTLQNRLVKAAMTERISDSRFRPTRYHENLYGKWSETGAGLLISGNVMIDRVHLESAGNVCFDDENMLPLLKRWAEAGQQSGNQFWIQISHSGRQTNRFNTSHPLAPSAVQLDKIGLFGKPRAMSEKDIEAVIRGFIKAAKLAKQAGFTGVQIHAAHGYLLNQFLSPRTNLRSDQWGGDINNRSRLLIEIIKGIRAEVGSSFPIAVKLNSSDFQRGGFTEEESLQVVAKLDGEGVDLLEISGGTYEKAAFFLMNEEGGKVRESTKAREAYFIDFARKVREISKIPLMVTGGFRSHSFCEEVLVNRELDLIGMARPFIANHNDIRDFLLGKTDTLNNLILRTGINSFEDAAEGGFYARNLIRLSKDQKVRFDMSPFWCANFLVLHELKKSLTKRLNRR